MESILSRYVKIKSSIKKLEEELLILQAQCKHITAIKNNDRYTCPECGKIWSPK